MRRTTASEADTGNATARRTRRFATTASGPYAAEIVAFWRRMLLVRIGITAVFLIALHLSHVPHALLLSAIAGAAGGIGTAWLWQEVTRRGVYPLLSMWADQIVVGVSCIIVPELVPLALLITMASISLVVIVLGQRSALTITAIRTVLFAIAVARHGPDAPWGLFLYGTAAAVAIITATEGHTRAHSRLSQRYDTVVDQLGLVVWEAADDRLAHMSDTIVPMLGRPASWYREHDWTEYVHPDDAGIVREHQELMRRGETGWNTHRVLAADGTVHWVEEFASAATPVDGELSRSFGVFFDVTRKHEREHDAKQWGAVVSQLSMPVFVCRLANPDDDASLTLEAANPIARSLIAARANDAVGARVAPTFPELVNSGFVALAADVARTGRSRTLPTVVPVLDGDRVRAMTTHLLALPDHAVAMVWIDATDTQEIAASIAREAIADHLTGLANRRALQRRLRQSVQPDGGGDTIGLLLLDLDNFKDVNDSLGYAYGDALLRAVAGRLRDLVGARGTVYRMGADEFAVVLPGPNAELGASLSGMILGALDVPFDLDGFTVLAGATIGSARYPQDATEADTLVQRADMSLHRAKRLNTGLASYSPDADRSSARRLTLLADLRRAIDAGELVPYYQPIADLVTGRLVAAEALVRWHHPVHGTIMPLEFIEGAEVSGLVGPLTAGLATRVAADLGGWVASGHELSVSINLSARNVHDRHLAVMLGDLRERHFEVAIDDFGTGYSSLGMLNSIPLDELKLDKTFVDDLAAGDARVVRSVVDLAHNLGLRVVAEGIEEPETLRLLTDLGCDRGQGWAIARPMPAEKLGELLGRAQAAGSWYAASPDARSSS